MILRKAQVVINTQALVNNLDVVKKLAPNSKILGTIKANAYGHGMLKIADILARANVDGFAVAFLNEALALRERHPDLPIIILQGIDSKEQLDLAVHHRLTSVISRPHQLPWLHNVPKEYLWLMINTGMNRLGLTLEQLISLDMSWQKSFSVIMTHYANADETEHPLNHTQDTRFNKTVEYTNISTLCAANSAVVSSKPNHHFDWLRPGIMLYGSSPIQNKAFTDFNLLPVMQYSAPLIAVNTIEEGESIGYGSEYICPKKMLVGVIATGYGDGYPRHAIEGTPIMIRQKVVPLIGRVSMDMVTVDLSSCLDAIPGDIAELWGNNISIDTVATHAETISYELLCSVGSRNNKTYQ